MTPEGVQITMEAFAAFGAWIAAQPDEIQEKDIIDLVDLYNASSDEASASNLPKKGKP